MFHFSMSEHPNMMYLKDVSVCAITVWWSWNRFNGSSLKNVKLTKNLGEHSRTEPCFPWQLVLIYDKSFGSTELVSFEWDGSDGFEPSLNILREWDRARVSDAWSKFAGRFRRIWKKVEFVTKSKNLVAFKWRHASRGKGSPILWQTPCWNCK